MRLRSHRIVGRRRTDPLAIADASDFELTDDGEVDAGLLTSAPNISLYCLDDVGRRAVFVETPPAVDLCKTAFLYQTQFESAERVLTLSYEDFLALGDFLATPPHPAGPPLVMLYSVGRCGSTLLARLFDRDEHVACLSEPDVLSQITGLREASGKRDEELTRLLRAAVHLQVHAAALSRSAAVWVLKPRSFSIETADLFHTAFPDAKMVFLYRSAADWARSATSAFDLLRPDAARSRYPLFRLVPLLRTFSPKVAGIDPSLKFLALMWLSPMQRALELRRAEIPILPIRYEDLITHRLPVIQALYQHCGVPVEHASQACEAFETDAQEGTVLSREALESRQTERLSEGQWMQLLSVLRAHPTIPSPDFVLPGTFSPECA